MKITYDDWQKEFLDTQGDKILCCGRQVGKSEICSADAGEYAVHNGKKNILMIAPTERQAYALFEKTLNYLAENYKAYLAKGKNRPTQTRIILTNGTKIFCLPTGLSGIGIRFLTVHRLYVDEASRIPYEVWTAVTPMLLTTGGSCIYLSTPFGSKNMFADIVRNKSDAYNSFKRFSVDSETVVTERKICETWTEAQRAKAIDYLASERKRMTKLEYAQEYEGKILDELKQFFSNELIQSCMTIKRETTNHLPFPLNNYLGVDVAGQGSDETVLFSVSMRGDYIFQFDITVIPEKIRTTDITDMIKVLDLKYSYQKIYIDDGGIGVGVFDVLLKDLQTRRKVVAINNSARPLDYLNQKGKRILKEDLYNNLLTLMEQGRIKLFDDNDIRMSLMSVQAEYTKEGRFRIYGNYTHIAEALIRAAWCSKRKHLNIWIA
jgi:hypothetical protein